MSLKLSGDDHGPYPRPVTLTLECDAATEMFCRGFASFTTGDVAPYEQAMAAGWKESPTGFFHCPECSGKRERKAEGFFDDQLPKALR